MSGENQKTQEIKRLTSPLKFFNSKAYDSDGQLISCIETLSKVNFVIEPKEGILSEDEIIQYAPESKAATKIRLKRGFGNIEDVLYVHESLPWIFGLYYLIIISIFIPVIFTKNILIMVVLLVLFIIPLAYSYYIFNLKSYEVKTKKIRSSPKPEVSEQSVTNQQPVVEDEGIPSLKKYEAEIKNLKVLFDVKEGVVKDLIEKRFEPPQITYDRFISMVESCHKLFYKQVDASETIIDLAVEDTPRIRGEIESKISNMKTIIDQIEELTNELVINISSENQSDEDVKMLLDDMENLIGSVKEY